MQDGVTMPAGLERPAERDVVPAEEEAAPPKRRRVHAKGRGTWRGGCLVRLLNALCFVLVGLEGSRQYKKNIYIYIYEVDDSVTWMSYPHHHAVMHTAACGVRLGTLRLWQEHSHPLYRSVRPQKHKCPNSVSSRVQAQRSSETSQMHFTIRSHTISSFQEITHIL